MANASHVDRNRLKSVAALEIVQQTAGSCPISSGLVGLWNDAGTIKWRDALGNDSTIPMQSGLPVFAAATKTAAPLAACTYANGTAGVGATLTANANGALGTIGGVNLTSSYLERTVLVDSQVTAAHNGLYSITSVGGGGSTWVLTRVPGMDGAIVDGAMVGVQEGTSAGILYIQTETVATVGTSDVAFAVSSTGVTWAAIVAAALTANSTLSLKKETNQTINVEASTTAATAGANLSVLSANGNGAVAGDMRIDTGTGTAGGVVKVGDTNAASITLGKAGVTTTAGPISLAANSNVSCLAGTTAVDLSLGTGIFKTPTGAITLGTGAISVTGDMSVADNKVLQFLGSTTGTGRVVERYGLTATEGLEIRVYEATVSPAAIETNLLNTPANSVILSVQGNCESALTGGGTTVTWSIGTAGTPDKYGTAGNGAGDTLAKNGKLDFTPTRTRLASAEQMVLTGCAAGGAADGDTALTVGSVRVRVVYATCNSLDDAP